MIKFAQVQEYLDLIVTNAGADPMLAPHRRFWKDYASLASDPLPSVKCQGAPFTAIKWIDKSQGRADADNSPLYLILTSNSGFCGKEQMPPGGPYVVDPGFTVSRKDGTQVTGPTIVAEIHEWISAGAPEL